MITPEMVERMRLLLEDGCSYREVARTLGVHSTAVRRRFPGTGWTQGEGASLRVYEKRVEARS